ncbi:MAG: hypothetical protein IKP97_04810 [Kiritimatiellae bacterium]|nr:hypothetical protein [Kiritimatiellia bacterium]
MIALLLAAVLYREGPVIVSGDRQVDPARSLFITVAPKGIDLRNRFRGFSVAEDYDDDHATSWRLVPEPCAEVYKIAPFAFEGKVYGPVYFDPPPKREAVGGAIETEPKRDLSPLTWRLASEIALALAAGAGAIWALWRFFAFAFRRVREHYLSPIERARVELERLIRADLPGKGRYKDFYVELTMVVRRYIQRKYGIKAPHLTTGEFLVAARTVCADSAVQLKDFLESADLVKFAGLAATPEMASEATGCARNYLEGDNVVR